MFGAAPGRKHFWHPHLQVETLSISGVKCLPGVTSWVVVGLGLKSRLCPSSGYTRNPYPLLP